MVRVPRPLQRALASPRAAAWLAAIAVVVLLPTLWSGLIIDDLFHRLAVEGRLGVPIGRLDLFSFGSRDPAWRQYFGELGVYPWWMGPSTQVSYFRPLASLTHFVDYARWPRAAWLMHAENLAWYAALVLASGALYRRFAGAAWVAGLATAFYAFDHAHAGPVAWIANRNALMAALFGVLAVVAHDRSRRVPRPLWAFAAWAAFTLALLSAESGVAIGGYLLAYAVYLDDSPRPSRARSLLPYALTLIGWRVAYGALGHGVTGTGVVCDPLANPAAFLGRAGLTIPLLAASDVVGVPADLLLERFSGFVAGAVVAVGVLALVGWALARLLRERATSRFFAAGALLSTLPLGGALPSDRYVFFVGLGIMGLLAQLAGSLVGPEGDGGARALVGAACLLLRGVVSPLAFPLRAAGPGIVHDEYERLAETFAAGAGSDLAEKTVVVINTPIDLLGTFLPVVRLGEGQPAPAHEYLLYAGVDSLEVSRPDERTLEIASARGWTPNDTDRTFRSAPFAVGDTVTMRGMGAEIRAITADGRARVVRFTFPVDLDDRALVFLASGPDGLERFMLPPAGARTTVAPAPLFLAGALKPHVRYRAVDDGLLTSRR